jgi:hypothetical protein
MIQVPHVHPARNHPIVFQQIASHLMASVNPIKAESESRIKAAKENHSIAITVKVANAVLSETASQLMASASRTKVEIVNHLIVKVVSAVHSEIASHLMASVNRLTVTTAKVESASLLAELKIQHVHPIKEIIAGIATRPLK